jgi:very-short-patch-repair endonuclease
MTLDDELRRLAERQHGLLAIDQLTGLGASKDQVFRRTRGRAWARITPNVIRLTGSPRTDEQRLLAAVLDAGPHAVLSHSSAAAWWGLPGFQHQPIHVTRPRGRTRRPSRLATVHEVLALLPQHLTVLRGIPVTRPSRVIFELAAQVHPQRAERACNNAWTKRLVTYRSLHAMLEDWAEHGRNGTTVMREMLEKRPPGDAPPASGLESRFEWILAAHGLEAMDRQVNLGGEEWLGRVDFKDRGFPLVVEILSETYHSALLDREADARRFAALDAAGFTVLSIWDTELWGEPRRVAGRVRAARAPFLRAMLARSSEDRTQKALRRAQPARTGV